MFSSVQMGWDYMKHRPLQRARRSRVGHDEEDIGGKIAIVTGSNSGLGKQAALELCKRGAVVVMACRDVRKAEEARDEILKEVSSAHLDPVQLDLGDLESVRKFVSVIKERYPRVDILINNAGISEPKIKKTKHGFESNMGVNHLGPFLLTLLLIDHLEKAEHGRVVCVSSSMLYLAKLDSENILPENQSRGFLGYEPYANSKLANALFVKELAKVLMKTNITCYALCPGLVATNVFRVVQQ
ncbi:unnamed protein product [Allacma fusca]|uniref:Uncharacterized protein n=1 Tax=Allacma fusca TaxID=39272 RepID=A0A8J2NL44_9HEXA|nr:unnamed protein product [Allacma fusca]